MSNDRLCAAGLTCALLVLDVGNGEPGRDSDNSQNRVRGAGRQAQAVRFLPGANTCRGGMSARALLVELQLSSLGAFFGLAFEPGAMILDDFLSARAAAAQMI
jgi:hypothetical protein